MQIFVVQKIFSFESKKIMWKVCCVFSIWSFFHEDKKNISNLKNINNYQQLSTNINQYEKCIKCNTLLFAKIEKCKVELIALRNSFRYSFHQCLTDMAKILIFWYEIFPFLCQNVFLCSIWGKQSKKVLQTAQSSPWLYMSITLMWFGIFVHI